MSTVVQSYVTIYLVGLLLSDICSLARKRAAIVAIDVSWLCYSCRRSTVPLQTQLNKKSIAPPIVEPESVSDQESGCTTAQWIWFPLVTTLYAAIVCNGDVMKMMETTSTLTWFEEWFLLFEMVWGKTLTQWVDAKRNTESTSASFGTY